MQDRSALAEAHQSAADGVAKLRVACDSWADAGTQIEALAVCEQLTRQLEQLSVTLVARLDRNGVFTDRGYSRAAQAVADLLGWDLGPASRRVRVAEQVCERVSLDGQVLRARLPDTAKVFAAGEVSLRHVEVIADALSGSAAGRLSPAGVGGSGAAVGRAGARVPATRARRVRPRPDQHPGSGRPRAPSTAKSAQVNELHLAARPGGAGGAIKGVFDAPSFDALLTALDALSKPAAEDRRSLAERRGDGLAELCRQRLDAGDLPTVGGQRPHLVVTVPLADLEARARAAACSTTAGR